MALIKCKECDKEISSDVKTCPNCGKKQTKEIGYLTSIIIIIGFFAFIGATGLFTPKNTRTVTLDGTDSEAGIVVNRINLWKDYNNRAQGVAGTANHGEKVKLMKQEGNGVLIETSGGISGWVTYSFIKELNGQRSSPYE